MESKKKNRMLYILISVLIASAIWFFVDEFGNNGGAYVHEKTITGVPVEYRSQMLLTNRGLMLLEEGTTSQVDLTFSGGRRLLARLDREDITVSADLSAISSSGVQTLNYRITYSNNRFNDLDRKTVSPSVAVVNISELSSKIIDVRCELVGNVAEGFSAGALQLEQDTLEIRGLSEDIDNVAYAKVVLDIGTAAEDTVSRALACQYYDYNDRLVDAAGIHPTTDMIRATLPIYVTKELQLTVDFVEAPGLRKSNLDYVIEPSTILVSGEAGKLRGVNSITLGQLGLQELLSSGASTYYYPISIPEGCQNLSGVTRATMQISFRDMDAERIPVTQIGYSNPPVGKQIEILTTELQVSVYGESAEVMSILPEHIYVTADLTEYSGASGTYNVPAEVVLAGDYDVGISGTYEIRIDIHEPIEEEPEEPTEDPTPEGEA